MKRLLIIAPSLMLVVGLTMIPFPTTHSAENPQTLPARSEMQKDRAGQVSVKTNPNGELTDAWYSSGGSTIKLSVRKEKTAQGTRGSLLFTEGNQIFLRMTADIIRPRKAGSLLQIRHTVTGKGIDYSTLVDISDTNHDRASVQIKSGQRTWKGAFDFQKWQPEGLREAPGLASVLSAEVKSKIGPFTPSLKSLADFYQRESKGWFTATIGQPPSPVGGTSENWLGHWWDGVIDWFSRNAEEICRDACYVGAGSAALLACLGAELDAPGCANAVAALLAASSECKSSCSGL